MHKVPLPVYPEVSINPKDGGAGSDGYSDAAPKPAPVRLQAGPATERGEWGTELCQKRPEAAAGAALGRSGAEGEPRSEARGEQRGRGEVVDEAPLPPERKAAPVLQVQPRGLGHSARFYRDFTFLFW